MEGDVKILVNMEKYWKNVVEENINEKGEFYALRWEVYVKYK